MESAKEHLRQNHFDLPPIVESVTLVLWHMTGKAGMGIKRKGDVEVGDRGVNWGGKRPL